MAHSFWRVRPIRLLGLAAVAGALTACATSLDLAVDSASAPASTVATATPVPEPTPTPAPEATPTPAATPTPLPTVVPHPPPPYDDAVDLYFADVEDFWSDELPDIFDRAFFPVLRRVPYDPSDVDSLPSCDGEVGPAGIYVGNAFYCGPDDLIAWDDAGLFPDLYDSFGDFAVGLVIAHEYGHAVQARVGLDGPTLFVELQADCLAGAWAGSVGRDPQNPLRVETDDLDQAIGGFLTFADPAGTTINDPGAHGSAFDRLSAFADGFNRGAGLCATYLDDPPTPAFVADFGSSGGDLALDELLPLLVDDLDPYLVNLADGAGFAYTELGAPVEFGGPAGEPPRCGDRLVVSVDLAGSGYYCDADRTVYYDRAELDDLWADAGDFAPAYIVVHSYATGFVVDAAPDIDHHATVLAADCVVGVWARDVFDQTNIAPDDRTHTVLLSAGDLDEGVVGLIAVAPVGPGGVDISGIGSFARATSFGAGFFEGIAGCALS